MTPTQPEDEANRYRRRNVLRSEKMYGEGFQSPGGLDAVKSFCRRLCMRQGMKILEVGSGLGGSAFYLAETYGAEVLGLDVSAEMVALSNERKEEKGLSNVSFRQGDIQTSDLETGIFDLVWTRDCILYVSEKNLVWSNVYAALKPGGQLFVTDFCRGRGPLSDKFETYLEECRYHLLTLDAYVRTLGAAGFRQIRMEDITTAFVGALRHEQERFVDNQRVRRKRLRLSDRPLGQEDPLLRTRRLQVGIIRCDEMMDEPSGPPPQQNRTSVRIPIDRSPRTIPLFELDRAPLAGRTDAAVTPM